jgi:predicted nucleic acid-binding Zn ribbon protein
MNRRRKQYNPKGLGRLFALALALSIICSPYLTSHSQSSPSPREALEQRIREDITRQLEIRNQPLDHASIEKLYLEDAEAAGLTYPELINLYETEYASQQAAQKPNPWEQFQPNIGWLVGFLSLSVLAYVTVLKKWLEARFQALNNWVYSKLSGTRLFRNIALRKYRAALVQNYDELPMPFIKQRAPLKMSEVYVPLKVSDIRDPKESTASARTGRTDSIDALKAISDHRRLMVIGEPGSGKTVLLKYLAWAYGWGKLDALSDRPTVVLVELYRLSDPALDEAKLFKALVDTFDRNQFPNAKNLVKQGLEAGTLMLLLDGLDEVNSEVRSHVVGVIRDFLKKCSKCRVVMTCRTAVYEDEFSDIADRKLEVVEFTDQQMRRFLKAWEPEMQQARKSINQMMAALRERPLIMKLARNPLLLTLIAYLYTEPAFVLPRSRAEFYEKSTAILLEQREYKGDDDYKHNRYEPNEKRRVLQHLALYTQDHSAELQDRRSLKASVVRDLVKQVLPSLDIPEQEARAILDEIADRSGLFMKIDGGERYLFPHLTVQEYFAATALQDQEPELIRRFATDPKAWREVVKLWCSLASDSTALVKAVYEKDPITGFECLAEARQVDQDLANQIIDRFKLEIDQPQKDEQLANAFGAVAANDRLRGQAVFAFLQETLNSSQASEAQRAFAADALSGTNLPKAATVLTAWYQDSKPIIRMGDLAVPELAKLANKGILKALDDLYAIATPEAANALVPLLWHEQTTVTGRTAWYLGGLLPQADVEDNLRDYPIKPEQRQAESLDWIWQPFHEPNHSALTTIAGRAAHLLQNSPLQLIPEAPPELDPRLVVPLCAIQLKPEGLPGHVPETVKALLEQTEQTPQLNQSCLQAVDNILLKGFGVNKQRQELSLTLWRQLSLTLPPKVELDLLTRLMDKPLPNRNHWRNLFEVIEYDLRTSWHYKGVLVIAAILSTITVASLGFKASINSEEGLITAAFVFSANVVLVFWLALREGIEERWEPNFFLELGPGGVVTFPRQITQAYRKQLIWSGFESIFEALRGQAVAGAVAVAGAGAVAGAVAGAGAVAVAFAGAVAFAFAVAVAGAVAGAGAGAVAVAFAGAVAGAVAGAGAVAFAFAGAVAVAVAGAAVGAWHRLKSNPENRWLKLLGLFAFPWFCWLPVVTIGSTWALYDLLTQVSPFTNIPIGLQTAAGVAIVAGIWAALWHRGQWLEARARNPFHGGALGELLGVKSQNIRSLHPGHSECPRCGKPTLIVRGDNQYECLWCSWRKNDKETQNFDSIFWFLILAILLVVMFF